MARFADPGYTPSVRAIGELLAAVAGPDDAEAKAAARAVLRIETQYAAKVTSATVQAAREAVRPGRARLTELAGRLAAEGRDPDGAARALLASVLEDADPKTRRAAARALGRLPGSKDELEAAFARAQSPDDARVLALALGKSGGDPDKLTGRAALIARRETVRAASSGADRVDRTAVYQGRVRFHVRSGLEAVVLDELRERRLRAAKAIAPGVVEADLDGPLSRALDVRTALHIGFPLRKRPAGELAETIAAALADEALPVLRAFTAPPIRFRVELPGGPQRAVVWKLAELVNERIPDLLNDPKDSTWSVVVTKAGGDVGIELVPRGHEDERFAWRQAQVPASSHPTIAAALARLLPVQATDVIWDPFVGAGAELVERALRGPYARLLGSDVDPQALAAARANLGRASVNATLAQADAATYDPRGVTAIVTNPPMGRRVERGSHGELLERFVAHAARVLAPGGVLVWMDPSPRRTGPVAERAGLRLESAIAVDMGGFSAELSRWRKPGRPR